MRACRKTPLHRGCPGFKSLSSHIVSAAAFLACTAVCQETARADAAETLARVAVLEAGLAEREHAAIWHVLRRRADRAGWPIERMARAYSSPVRRGHWPAWAAALPGHVWSRVVTNARAFLGGGVGDPCPGAWHWGDRRGDLARALRAGWRRVDCGPTKNLFWAP